MLIIDNRSGKRPTGDIWEQAGSKIDTMPARDAFNLFPGYEPKIEDLFRKDERGVFVQTGHRGIFMDGFKEPLAIVKGRYTQVTPSDFVDMWDDEVGMNVLAMGAAGGMGETFYLAAEIGDLEIKRDPVKMYLMGTAPQGMGAASVRLTPVRMFCTNQMHASKKRAVINANIPHNNQVRDSLRAWMSHLSITVKARMGLVAEDFNKMMEADATEDRINTFIERVYRLPEERDFDALPTDIGDRRRREYVSHLSMAEGRRRDFRVYYEGKMTGGENLGENMYRAYNAAVELAQYRKGITNEDNRAVSALLGKRAEEIETIYDTTLAVIAEVR